jgi:hypothetical protein
MVAALPGLPVVPWSVTSDAKTLAAIVIYSTIHIRIVTLAMPGESKFQKLLSDDSDYVYNEPMISPNRQWLAYFEGAVTTPQVNVRPFPDVRQRPVTVSAPNTGLGPAWSGDGSELFYASFPADGIWAASVQYAPFKIGTPQRLFRRTYWYGGFGTNGSGGRAWDPDPNGKRFLVITRPALRRAPTLPKRTKLKFA